MKQEKKLSALAAGAVTMGLLLGASAASAASAQFDSPLAPTQATGILGLEVGGTPYNVTFALSAFANEVYGECPGEYTFTTEATAIEANGAVRTELTLAGATSVGNLGQPGIESDIYNIGCEGFILPRIDAPVPGSRSWWPTEHMESTCALKANASPGTSLFC